MKKPDGRNRRVCIWTVAYASSNVKQRWPSPAYAARYLVGLRAYGSRAIGLVWLCIGVGMVDTVNAVIQSVRFSVFDYALGANWVIVTMYVPALLVSSLLVVLRLRR